MENTMTNVSKTAKDVAQTATNTVKAHANGANKAIQEVDKDAMLDKALKGGEQIMQQATEILSDVRGRINEAVDQVSESLRNAHFRDVVPATRSTIKKHPFVALAVGGFVGFFVGRAIKRVI